MCTTCGCSDDAEPRVIDLATAAASAEARQRERDPARAHRHARVHDPGRDHGPLKAHVHDHSRGHDHEPEQGYAEAQDHRVAEEAGDGAVTRLAYGPTPRRLRLEQAVLARNRDLAERNQTWLEARRVVAWNLMSSPGAGKTTLLERTLRDLGAELAISVIEGDQATVRDGERIRAAGGRVVQINTGTGCHLDAAMLAEALERLDPPAASLVLIENVGNLVCPALFDLGEAVRAVLLSVTEGEDKPLKYPHMFLDSEVMILTKTDLLPHVPFDLDRCLAYARQVNPRLEIVQLSAISGEGLDAWYARLRRSVAGG
jgi:hydrogenase nickel incorporation protein HypB